MKELLERYGYSFDGKCNCDGFYTEKYNKDEYHIRLRPIKQQFKIKKYARSLTNWIPVNMLQQTLNNIHIGANT